jgi:hypothetical protein
MRNTISSSTTSTVVVKGSSDFGDMTGTFSWEPRDMRKPVAATGFGDVIDAAARRPSRRV